MLRILAAVVTTWAISLAILCLTGPSIEVVWLLGLCWWVALWLLQPLVLGREVSHSVHMGLLRFVTIVAVGFVLATGAAGAYARLSWDPIGQASDDGWGTLFPSAYHQIETVRNGEMIATIRRSEAPWAGYPGTYFVLIYRAGGIPNARDLAFRETTTLEGFSDNHRTW